MIGLSIINMYDHLTSGEDSDVEDRNKALQAPTD